MDPGQPLVNAIRSDSALIGGNADDLGRSTNSSLKYRDSRVRTFIFRESDIKRVGKKKIVSEFLRRKKDAVEWVGCLMRRVWIWMKKLCKQKDV